MKLLSESLRRRKFIIWPGEREGEAAARSEELEGGSEGGRAGWQPGAAAGLCDPQPGSVAASLPAGAGAALPSRPFPSRPFPHHSAAADGCSGWRAPAAPARLQAAAARGAGPRGRLSAGHSGCGRVALRGGRQGKAGRCSRSRHVSETLRPRERPPQPRAALRLLHAGPRDDT